LEETKKWLNRAYTIDKEIKVLKAELKKANLAATSLATQRIKEKVQTSKVNNADCAILKCVEYSEQITQKLGELYATKIEISETISRVDDGKFRILLRMRYLEYASWGEIANEMDYSIRHIHYTHNEALEEVKDIIAHNFSVKCDIV
jgi:DNA-directed RNA polymerase specialized sigma24 family protein